MNRPSDERLLAFLEGRMDETERATLLDALDDDPELSRRLRAAAAGLDALGVYAGTAGVGGGDPKDGTDSARARRRRVVPRWWIPAAVAATLALAVPGTLWLGGDGGAGTEALRTGIPESPRPTFVLVLHGRWPDLDTLSAADTRARALEYWAWTSRLAEEGVLVAAGDLRWEPGERLGPGGAAVAVAVDEQLQPDYIVGVFALRATSYEQALSLARQCPHLRYGGSISIRRVGSGFVTVPGMGDWTD